MFSTKNTSQLTLLNNPQKLGGLRSKIYDKGRRGAKIGKDESKMMIRLKTFLRYPSV